MLKTVVMFNIFYLFIYLFFVETTMHFFQDFLRNKKLKEHILFEINMFCITIFYCQF